MTNRSITSRSALIAAGLALVAGTAAGRFVMPMLTADRDAQPSHSDAPAAAVQRADLKRFQVPVSSSQASEGPSDALVTIVEWCDFKSMGCRRAEPIVESIMKDYAGKVRLVFRNFIATSDNEAQMQAHEFARAALEQGGKFWEARQLMMLTQGDPTPVDLEHFSQQLGLDWSAVSDALGKHSYAGQVLSDRAFAELFEVREAPAFFVNGRRLLGASAAAALRVTIDDELARTSKLIAGGVAKENVYAELTKDGAWHQPDAVKNP